MTFFQAHSNVLCILWAVLICGVLCTAKSKLIGAFTMPHGGIILDPYLNLSTEPAFHQGSMAKIWRLHEAITRAGEDIARLKPDLIILSTPHGYYLEKHFVVLSSPKAYGSATVQGKRFEESFFMNKTIAADFFLFQQNSGVPVELLSLGIGGELMSLKWAEVIPWHFIARGAKRLGVKLPSVIYIGQPPVTRIKKLERFGAAIYDWAQFQRSYRRIVVVVSSDLSHYHSRSTSSPYSYNKKAPVFDELVVSWAKLDRNDENEKKASQILTEEAFKIKNFAGSCGYNGLVMLNNIFKTAVMKYRTPFKATFYDYQVPTYFGMMIAAWVSNI